MFWTNDTTIVTGAGAEGCEAHENSAPLMETLLWRWAKGTGT